MASTAAPGLFLPFLRCRPTTRLASPLLPPARARRGSALKPPTASTSWRPRDTVEGLPCGPLKTWASQLPLRGELPALDSRRRLRSLELARPHLSTADALAYWTLIEGGPLASGSPPVSKILLTPYLRPRILEGARSRSLNALSLGANRPARNVTSLRRSIELSCIAIRIAIEPALISVGALLRTVELALISVCALLRAIETTPICVRVHTVERAWIWA